jgi:hypothetical protein
MTVVRLFTSHCEKLASRQETTQIVYQRSGAPGGGCHLKGVVRREGDGSIEGWRIKGVVHGLVEGGRLKREKSMTTKRTGGPIEGECIPAVSRTTQSREDAMTKRGQFGT